MTALVLLLLAQQPLAEYPGAPLTHIGNDLVIGGEYYRLGYFTTGDSPKKVANWFRKQWEEQGYPVTADGDFVREGVISAFYTRQGLVRSIVLRPHAGKTVGFSVLKDLWVQPEHSKPDQLPPLENALFANDLVTRELAQHRTAAVEAPLQAVRDARDVAWTKAGFQRARESRTEGNARVLEYSKGGQQVLVTLMPLDDRTTGVDELWVGASK
jgi:hypothetical protein